MATSARKFRHEEFIAPPRGSRVRTVTRGGHRIRLAFPAGPRRRGAGEVVSVLHPKGENPFRRLATALWSAHDTGKDYVVPTANGWTPTNLVPSYGTPYFQVTRHGTVEYDYRHHRIREGPSLDQIREELDKRPATKNQFGAAGTATGSSLVDSIRHGDRVTIVDRFGQQRSGRAVMVARGGIGWVLNMGGAHGTPGIATPENVVRVRKTRNPVRALTAADVKAGRVWYLDLTDRFGGQRWFVGPMLAEDAEREAHEYRRAGIKADSISAPTGYQAKVEKNPAGILTGLEVAHELGIEPGKLLGIRKRNAETGTFGGPISMDPADPEGDRFAPWRASLLKQIYDLWMDGKWSKADYQFIRRVTGLEAIGQETGEPGFFDWSFVRDADDSIVEAIAARLGITAEENPQYSADPRWLTAKYGGKCRQCGRAIRPGESIFYYPRGKHVLCEGETCGRQAAREFGAAAADERMMSGGNPRRWRRFEVRANIPQPGGKRTYTVVDQIEHDVVDTFESKKQASQYAAQLNRTYRSRASSRPRENPPRKVLTREQLEKRQAKAVKFLRDVVGDSDKADEIAGLSLEEYAAKKKVTLGNPETQSDREINVLFRKLEELKENPLLHLPDAWAQASPQMRSQLLRAAGTAGPFSLLSWHRLPVKAQKAIARAAAGRASRMSRVLKGENPVIFVGATKAQAEAEARAVRAGGNKSARARPCWVDKQTGIVVFRRDDWPDASIPTWCVQARYKQNPYVFSSPSKKEAEEFARRVRAFGDPSAQVRACWVDKETGLAITSKDKHRRGLREFCVMVKRENPALRNPEAAAGLYKSFHGRPAAEVLEFEAARGGVQTGLGQLRELVSDLPNGKRLEMMFTDADQVLVTSNAVNGTRGTQLYFVGGNQDISSLLEGEDLDVEKDTLNLGRARQITYRGQKRFDNFETIDYVHKFGEGGKEKPVLLYDRLGKTLSLAGGEYEIQAPGIMG